MSVPAISVEIWLARFLVGLLLLAGCDAGGRAADDFHQGRRLVVTGRYEEALPVLERYLEQSPGGRHASRASFFHAKAHLGLGRLDDAEEGFRRTVDRYPGSLEARKSAYKLALIELLRGRRERALELFSRIADQPNSPLAPEAEAMRRYLAGHPEGD